MRALASLIVALLPLTLLAGCGDARLSHLGNAVTDSLPGGIPRVISAGPTAWTDSSGVLVEESRFSGEEGTDSELGEPRSLAVDQAGRVYVVDSKPAVIKVYTPGGRLIRTIGHEGEGPGEFRVGFIAVRGSHLVLHDPMVSRTSVWDTAGTFLRSWHSSCCHWSDIQLDRAGRIYVPSMIETKAGDPARGVPYVRYTVEGAAVDTLWTPPRRGGSKRWTIAQKKDGKLIGMMMNDIPFLPGVIHSLHPDGGILSGWTGEYRIVRSAAGTDSIRVFGRSWSPDPVTAEQRNAKVASMVKRMAGRVAEADARAAFKVEDVPATLPAFMALHADESGRVWARRYAASDTGKTRFDVFDSTGAFLGPVTAPFPLSERVGHAWTGDGVVTLIDGLDGRPAVVRLKLKILP